MISLKKSLVIFLLCTLFTSVSFAKKYKGAEYRTKEAYVYGRFDVSYKPAYRDGVVSSFFTYHNFNSETGWNEIDIEFIGKHSELMQFNTITPGQKFHIRSQYLDFNPYTDFHDYAFEWTPDYVAWFIDGEEVYRQTGEFVKTLIYPQQIMMNIWNPVYTNWVGYWNDAYLPANSYYDWVSYSAYTPGSGNTGTNSDFTLSWRDDFDSFDEERWEKSTHTFGGNECDFIVENAVFEDGKLILCLTNSTELGLVDKTKPDIIWARENYDSSVDIMFSEELNAASLSTTKFLLPGVVINKAELLPGNRLVKLSTTNYDFSKNYNIISMNIEDDSEQPNIMGTKVATIKKISGLQFPFNINVGGDTVRNYFGDQEWSAGTDYGFVGGDVKNWRTTEISGTDDDDIFLSERKGLDGYKIHVPDGTYKVKLSFSENDNNSPGQRVFDVVLEGELIADNLDVVNLIGKNKLYEIEKEINVADEIIDIYFPAEVDSSFINSITIDQISTGIGSNNSNTPLRYELMQNYPNPFNPVSVINYQISETGHVNLCVYDLLGREVSTLVNETQTAGNYKINFNAASLASGVYLYKLNAGKFSSTRKMLLMK